MARSGIEIETPIGPLRLVAAGGRLVELELPPLDRQPPPAPTDDGDRQLLAVDLPLDLEGTPFQQRVWRELCEIPYGETISYGELAIRIGKPGSARAVGLANGQNPIAVIVPCHRVIGSTGKLTGYGGGLERKRALLDLESSQLALI